MKGFKVLLGTFCSFGNDSEITNPDNEYLLQ